MTDTPSTSVTRPTLLVHPWPDPVLDELGYDPRTPYVERFWLPIIGPSSVLLLRHLAARFDAEPEGYEIVLDDMSRSLGLGPASPNSAFARTMQRCGHFGLTQPFGRDAIAVRRKLAPLTRRQVQRLPEPLQAEHASWIRASA